MSTKKAPPISRRQGDVLTVVVKAPKNLTPLEPEDGRVVLAHGEVTGHAHAFYGMRATLLRADDTGGGTFLNVGAGDDLKHEEHSTIHHPPLPEGLAYRVFRQTEYHPQALRNVAD